MSEIMDMADEKVFKPFKTFANGFKRAVKISEVPELVLQVGQIILDDYYTQKENLIESKRFPEQLETNEFYEDEKSDASPKDKVISYIRSHPEASCTALITGNTEEGHSVCLRIDGFMPYIWVELPDDWDHDRETPHLRRSMAYALFTKEYRLKTTFQKRYRLMGFVPADESGATRKQFNYLEVRFPTVSMYNQAKHKLPKTPMRIPGRPDLFLNLADVVVPLETQFTDDTKCAAETWVQIDHYKIPDTFCSSCQIEVTCDLKDLRPREDITKMAPKCIASFDIECAGKTGFPMADLPEDYVIQIGINFSKAGMPEDQAYRVVLCLGDTSPPEPKDRFDIQVYQDEAALIEGFRDYVCVLADADVVIGYNIFRFDFPYIRDRLVRHVADPTKNRFYFFGKILHKYTPVEVKTLDSSALGENDMTFPQDAHGRVFLDLYQLIKSGTKNTRMTLDIIAEKYLGKNKIDMDKGQLSVDWHEGNPDKRLDIARYCIVDCDLPLGLLWCAELDYLTFLSEMAQVTFTSIKDLTTRGQGIKVLNVLTHFAHKMGYVMNFIKLPGEGYKGATVLDPIPGYYAQPIVTLDFASLYPSIMRAHNLCWSSVVLEPSYRGLQGATYDQIVTESGTHHIIQHIKGVLPEMLETLLTARSKARQMMNSTEDPKRKRQLNNKQNAFKITANSCYGFCGANELGKYPCIYIAECTTSKGREMIHQVKQFIEENFPGAKVVYGDTDSVMINFQLPGTLEGVAQAFEMGWKAEKMINTLFRKQIKITMEKVYYPYLLCETKKRYAANCYMEPPPKKPKRDTKGFDMVRRSTPGLIARVQSQFLDQLMEDGATSRAIAGLTNVLGQLERNELPYEDFCFSTSMKRTYKNEDGMLQVKVKRDMEARNPGSGPKPGDRVFMVIAEKKNAIRKVEQVEEFQYAKDNKILVDRMYYLDRLEKSMEEILKSFDLSGVFDSTRASLRRQREKNQSIRGFAKVVTKPVEVIPVISPPNKPEPVTKQPIQKRGTKRPAQAPPQNITSLKRFMTKLQ